jgi:hypothetical protein
LASSTTAGRRKTTDGAAVRAVFERMFRVQQRSAIVVVSRGCSVSRGGHRPGRGGPIAI